MSIFQANFPKIEPLKKVHPGILEKKSVLRYAETSPICYWQPIPSRLPPTNSPSK